MMKLSVKVAPPKKEANTCLLIGAYEQGPQTETFKSLDQELEGYLSYLYKSALFEGKMGQTFTLLQPQNSPYEHIILLGFGKPEAITLQNFRKNMLCITTLLQAQKVKDATCYLTEIEIKNISLAQKIQQIVEGFADGFYRFNLFKTTPVDPVYFKGMTINVNDARVLKEAELALREGEAISNGVMLTKNLANLPSNICTPTFLADQAKDLGKQHSSISVEVLDANEMRKLKMGALLGVAQGSAEEPKMICLQYKGGSKREAPIALIGKGVTFDTGGNSLKPADSMVGMKYDMCGAATVLGTFKAAAELKLPVNLVGIIPAVENMPGGTAYKPEDILTSMAGLTIEVISTDAEGRLILADALTYCERFKPDVVIDIATLTGAVVIALGFHATGLVANDEKLGEDLLQAGKESNDRAWPLPLWDEYQEQIKSPFADIANTGGRSAGTITAGCFLSRFAKTFKWAHLDVAGTAAMMMGTNERMATGRPVPMLVQYLLNRVEK